MRIKIKNLIDLIIKSLYKDRVNLYFIISSVLMLLVAYSLWVFVIIRKGIFIYTPLDYGPHVYVLIILILHTLVSIYSYDKDEKISHLLFGSVAFFSFMSTVLMLVYMVTYG